jgi:hypothetical protein
MLFPRSQCSTAFSVLTATLLLASCDGLTGLFGGGDGPGSMAGLGSAPNSPGAMGGLPGSTPANPPRAPGSIGSTPSTPPAMGGTPTGGFTPAAACAPFSPSGVCQQCTFSRCCNQQIACFHPTNADPRCKALLDCVDTCADGDNACLQRCIDSNQAGLQLFAAFTDCKDNSCGAQCGDGPPAGNPPPSNPPAGNPPPAGGFTPAAMCAQFSPSNSCQQCTFSRCCSEQLTCFHPTNANPNCKALLDCIDTCADNDNACVMRCVNSNQAGVQLFAAYLECKDTKCVPPCAAPAGSGRPDEVGSHEARILSARAEGRTCAGGIGEARSCALRPAGADLADSLRKVVKEMRNRIPFTPMSGPN